jgi:TPR repeat protein
MTELPRNMNLKAFDPHRSDFVCKHEADVVPPIDPQAEQWLQEGLALTSPLLWPDQRDYKKAIDLWTRAAARKHWKAMLNLANAYAQGEGVETDTEHAVKLVEEAMTLGIPSAYDLMGTYHMEGRGVKQDASRAHAFWELAADKGSASAQALLGAKLVGTYDDPKSGFWGNRKVALKMLECGVAQGSGKAAYELGTTLKGTRAELGESNVRALKVLQQGVKLGSAESAASLYLAFLSGAPLVGSAKDQARGERYEVLADALRRNPDLRLPNLDKVLPLPPAPLPQWNGNKQTLIDATKAVLPARGVGTQRTSRAEFFDWPELLEGSLNEARVAQGAARYVGLVEPIERCNGGAVCPHTGVWQARVPGDDPAADLFNQWHRQSYVLEGGAFPIPAADWLLDVNAQRITWWFWSEANHWSLARLAQVSIGDPPGGQA